MIPIVSVPPEFSGNPPDRPTAQCRECGVRVSLDERSVEYLKRPECVPFCVFCAAKAWPDMEIAGTEGAWVSVESFGNVDVATVRIGRLRLRDYVAGAQRVP